VLTVAGTDPSGGAGVAADLRTFAALRVHGALAVAVVTAQDGDTVSAVRPCPPELLDAQIAAVSGSMAISATKTGLLATAANAEVVAARRADLGVLVVDPVLRASSGSTLVEDAMAQAYLRSLVPLATVVTPNLAEAEALTGRRVSDLKDMRQAAALLVEAGAGVAVVTGGHLAGGPIDVFFDGSQWAELAGARVVSENNRGTGCTFSAALAAEMALGRSPLEATRRAGELVRRALAGSAAWGIAAGPGPLDQLGWGSAAPT